MKITFLVLALTRCPINRLHDQRFPLLSPGVCNFPKQIPDITEPDPQFWSNGTVFLLIDVSADFRQQVLRESVKKIDSVLITHGHADHVTGIPDIRSYTREKPVPLYGSEESVDMIRKSYSYVFEYPPCTGGGIPQLITNKVDSPFYLSDQKVIPVLVGHGDLKGCFGYRIGPLAYIPDMRTIDDENLKNWRVPRFWFSIAFEGKRSIQLI